MQQQVFHYSIMKRKNGTTWWQAFSRSGVQGWKSDNDNWDVGAFFVAIREAFSHFDKPPGDTAESPIISACYAFHTVQKPSDF